MGVWAEGTLVRSVRVKRRRWLALPVLLAGMLQTPAATARDAPFVLAQGSTARAATLALEAVTAPTTTRDIAALAARPGAPLPQLDALTGARSFWTRLHVRRAAHAGRTWMLTPDRGWKRVELYDAHGVLLAVNGVDIPLWERPIAQGRAMLPLRLNDTQPHTFILHFAGDLDGWEPPAAFLEAIEPESVALHAAQQRHLGLGLYTGLLLAIAFVNVLFARILRDRLFIDYLLYAIPYALIWLSHAFIGAEYLWPWAPRYDNHVLFVVICAAIVFGNRFASRFLSLPREAPWLDGSLHAIDAWIGAAVLLAMFGQWRVVSMMLGLGALATSVVYVWAGVVTTLRGLRVGRYFLLATGTMALGTIVYTLNYFEIVPDWPLVAASAQLGSAAEMVLLAFALGDRVRHVEGRRRRAEKHLRKGLERQVALRTAELASANTELIQVNRRLEELSLTDPLTGVANRRHFQSALDDAFQRAQTERGELSVMLVDVDLFKDYNDEYGHQAGDECLRRVAQLLTGGTRKASDLVARYGGEEFILIMPGMAQAAAVAHAERLRRSIADARLSHPRSPVAPHVTISIGVASLDRELPAQSGDELIMRADRALYRAKNAGRDRVATDAFASGAWTRGSVESPAQRPERGHNK
jgi:diguanylate cyclase (GGDEF)-like protein